MYNLFTKRFLSNNAVLLPPAFELFKRIYQREILNIVSYYNDRVYVVPSNHLLCRILTTAEIPYTYEIDRYMEVALARSPYVAKHFNFTSEINYGRFFDGVFYGEGNTELIIYNEEYFNPYEAIQNWKAIQAVQVLEHPVTDLGLLLPNGKENSTDKGLVVISINIPMLLLQYRGFQMEQRAKGIVESNSSLGVAHFVHMYVLPNMLYSHIELVILNRLMNLFYGAPMGDSLHKHPFLVVNYGDKLDKILESILRHVQDARMQYLSVLKNIPSVFEEDVQQALMMPDFAKTRQIWWSLVLSRMRIIKFLLDVGGENGVHVNRSYVNKFQLVLKRLLDENLYKAILPRDLYFDTEETIKEIQAL